MFMFVIVTRVMFGTRHTSINYIYQVCTNFHKFTRVAAACNLSPCASLFVVLNNFG